MITLTEIEERVGYEFPLWRDGQVNLSKHLEDFSFAEDGSFKETGIERRREWFEQQSDKMEKLMASILPNHAPCVHSAIGHLFMGPIEQDIRNLEQRDHCYCRLVEALRVGF